MARTALCCLGVEQTVIYYLSRCTVGLGDYAEVWLLWITQTMSEGLITVQVTCPPLPSALQTRCPETAALQASQASVSACMYGSGTQVVRSQSQGHPSDTSAATEKKGGRTRINSALQHCDSPATLDPRQHHSALSRGQTR